MITLTLTREETISLARAALRLPVSDKLITALILDNDRARKPQIHTDQTPIQRNIPPHLCPSVAAEVPA